MQIYAPNAPKYVWRPAPPRPAGGASAFPRPSSRNEGPTSGEKEARGLLISGAEGKEGRREGRKGRGKELPKVKVSRINTALNDASTLPRPVYESSGEVPRVHTKRLHDPIDRLRG